MSRRVGLGLLILVAVIGGVLLAVLLPRESDTSGGPTPVLVATQTIPAPSPTTYSARDVERALGRHGFEVDAVFDRTRDATPDASALGLLNLFGEVEGWEALVADTAPDGAIGATVSAWIFDDVDHADSFAADSALRLQNGNVVVLTDAEHREAASAALDDLR